MTMWILGASLFVQCAAAILALRLNRLTGRRIAWIAISLALSLMALRRAISMWGHLENPGTRQLNPTAEVVALSISGLMLVGMILIAPIFSSIISDRELHRKRRLTDELTGLPNRIALETRLDKVVASAAADDSLMGVVFIDIDRFKSVNDSFGHSQGDLVLQTAAKRIRAACRESDFVARWGGDEFVVILSDLASQAEAELLSERFTKALSEPVALRGRTLTITASLGIVLSRGSEGRHSLLRDADLAMYKAKSAGPSQRVVFASAMRDVLAAQARLEQDLLLALGNDELRIHFQPVFRSGLERVDAVEALVRWQHPDHGLLKPDAFFAAAQSAGLMQQIDEWVLTAALRQISEWRSIGGDLSRVRVMVNSSVSNFGDLDYPERVKKVLDSLRVSPDRLILELFERAVLDQPKVAHQIIDELRGFGVSVFLDDFGTGYSSLSYLTHLYVDGIKIDRSFVAGVGEDEKRLAIIKSIVSIADTMQIPVVAEGIESEADLQAMKDAGASLFQGHALAHPQSREELEELILT